MHYPGQMFLRVLPKIHGIETKELAQIMQVPRATLSLYNSARSKPTAEDLNSIYISIKRNKLLGAVTFEEFQSLWDRDNSAKSLSERQLKVAITNFTSLFLEVTKRESKAQQLRSPYFPALLALLNMRHETLAQKTEFHANTFYSMRNVKNVVTERTIHHLGFFFNNFMMPLSPQDKVNQNVPQVHLPFRPKDFETLINVNISKIQKEVFVKALVPICIQAHKSDQSQNNITLFPIEETSDVKKYA